MKRYLKTTSAETSLAINKKAFDVVYFAAMHTPRANRSEITAYFKWTRRRDRELRAFYHRCTSSFPGIVSADPEKKVRAWLKKTLAARRKSIGYIKGAWQEAYIKLRKAGKVRGVGRRPRLSAKMVGRKKGEAVAAHGNYSRNHVALFWNYSGRGPHANKKVHGQKHSYAEAARKFGGKALKKGFRIVQGDMNGYMIRKLQGAANKSGAGKRRK